MNVAMSAANHGPDIEQVDLQQVCLQSAKAKLAESSISQATYDHIVSRLSAFFSEAPSHVCGDSADVSDNVGDHRVAAARQLGTLNPSMPSAPTHGADSTPVVSRPTFAADDPRPVSCAPRAASFSAVSSLAKTGLLAAGSRASVPASLAILVAAETKRACDRSNAVKRAQVCLNSFGVSQCGAGFVTKAGNKPCKSVTVQQGTADNIERSLFEEFFKSQSPKL